MTRRAYGTGSVYQRKSDGRWIGGLPDGHGGVLRYVTGTTKEQVEKRLLDPATSSTSRRTSGSETVTAFLKRWIDDAEASRALRPSTVYGYRLRVRLHIAPHIGRIHIADLEPQDVQRLMTKLSRTNGYQTGRPLSAQSVKHVHKILRTSLGQAEKWGLVERNVARLVTPPRVTRPAILPLTVDEARAFLAATVNDPRYPLYLLAITTGMRRGELLGLHWQDVDLDAGTLLVRYSLRQVSRYRFAFDDPKTDRSRRTLYLTPDAVRALREARSKASSATYVFARADGRPLAPSEVTRVFQQALADHGLPRKRFHDLRHTAASLMLEGTGGDLRAVMATMGHSTIGTTVDIYGGMADEAKRRASEGMDRVLGRRANG